MTAEIIYKETHLRNDVPFGTELWWVTASGEFARLLSLEEKKGFEVVIGGSVNGEVMRFTPEYQRKFLLPNGDTVVPT